LFKSLCFYSWKFNDVYVYDYFVKLKCDHQTKPILNPFHNVLLVFIVNILQLALHCRTKNVVKNSKINQILLFIRFQNEKKSWKLIWNVNLNIVRGAEKTKETLKN